MDIHGIFYVSKAQMIENLPPNEETDNEPMETAPSEQDKNEKNGETTLPNGETNVAQVISIFWYLNCTVGSIQ